MRPSGGRRLRHALGMAALVTGLLACLARLAGDRSVAPAILIYATPWLVSVGLATATLILARKPWRLGGLVVLAVGLLGGLRSWRSAAPPSVPGRSFTVAVWNAGRTLAERPEAWQFEADLVAVVESGSFSAEQWQRFVAASPGHRWTRLDGGTLLGTRGRVLQTEDFGLHDRYRCHRATIGRGRGGPLRVVVVDIRSQPWRSREQAIRTALERAGEGPALVMGDFNTPPESRWFDDFAGGYTLGNDAQSQGFVETWPWGCPLLALDQVWLSPGLVAVDARQQARGSDHRLVEITVVEPGAGD